MAAQLPFDLMQSLTQAAQLTASDFHLEATQAGYQVRVRKMGQLRSLTRLPTQVGIQWVAALKNAAGVDVTQKRKAQDGRFHITQKQLNLDCRFSSIPTFWGEKVVLRLFNRQEKIRQLDSLGLSEAQNALIKSTLLEKEGFIVATGPTGSGKTRTLYAMLDFLNQPTLNISTVEDPIEIPFEGMNQTAVEPQINWRFADCLRALLRQDPDILMVGEIRDAETAQIAMQAAQTGHLVLATLHANHPLGAFVRLKQLGIDRVQLASTIKLIINQRLVQTQTKCVGYFEVCHLNEARQQKLLGAAQESEFWQLAAALLSTCLRVSES